MSVSPGLSFICYTVSFFVRSKVAWNPVKVKKAFHKPTDGGFSRNMEYREGKTECSINVFFSENQELPFQ